jgi:glycosyltransferase involved in cell wall biosynthesis
MRIALVSSSIAPERIGGSEIYAGMLATALAEHHDVVLYTGASKGPQGVETVRLPGLPELPPNAPALRKAAWHAGDQWLHSVHRALKRELRVFRPEVVHSHHPQGLSAAVFTAVSACGARHAHTVHDANVLCARITMMRDGRFCGGRCLTCRPQRLIRGNLLARHLHRLIAPSDYFRDMHVRAGVVPPERAETIRQGAHPGTTRLRARREGGELVVGYLGTLAVHKGVRTLLHAFRGAPAEWRLRLAGSGPLERQLVAEARRDLRLELTGFVSGERKDAFLNALDVLVIPSEYEENAPLVAVEAAVRALPAVVSDRGGLPETPEAGVFRAGDSQALLEALRRFADSEEELANRSRRLDDMTERFVWSHHVEHVERALAATAR